MKQNLLLATASTIVLTGASAHAQTAQPAFNWSGFYVGINAGMATHEATTLDFNDWNGGYVTKWFRSRNSDFTFGGQVGYNWQVGSFVFGLEADASYMGIKDTFKPSNTANQANCGVPCTVSATNELSWLATFRGRAGLVAANQILIYATAGLAVAKVDNHWGWGDQNNPNPLLGGFSDKQFSVSGTKAGLAFGGGVEFMPSQNWTVRLEGLVIDLDDSSTTISGTPYCCVGGGISSYRTDFGNNALIGRAALNYKW